MFTLLLFHRKFRWTIPVAAVIEADVVEDIVCIVVKLVEDCSSDVCEFNSVLGIDDDDADCCCCGNAGSSVNRNAISKSRNTSVSLDSIKLKRLRKEHRENRLKKVQEILYRFASDEGDIDLFFLRASVFVALVRGF